MAEARHHPGQQKTQHRKIQVDTQAHVIGNRGNRVYGDGQRRCARDDVHGQAHHDTHEGYQQEPAADPRGPMRNTAIPMPVNNGTQGLNANSSSPKRNTKRRHVVWRQTTPFSHRVPATPHLALKYLGRPHGPCQYGGSGSAANYLPRQLCRYEKHQHGEHRLEHLHVGQPAVRQGTAQQRRPSTPPAPSNKASR